MRRYEARASACDTIDDTVLRRSRVRIEIVFPCIHKMHNIETHSTGSNETKYEFQWRRTKTENNTD